MTSPRTWLVAFLVSGLAGCNPIDPFDPECQSGAYSCEPLESQCPCDQVCHQGLCVSKIVMPDGSSRDGGPAPDGTQEKGVLHLDGATFSDAGGCADADREPNNSSTLASLLASEGSYAMEICYPGDVDHISFPVPVGKRLRATIQFSHEDGDLDAALLDPNGATIDRSQGFGDTEVLLMGYKAPKADRYIVGVAGYNGAVNRYSLLIELE